MSNPQFYNRFTTKVVIYELIGVTRQQKVLLECVAQGVH